MEDKFCSEMCYFLIAYVVKVQKMAIIPFKLHFSTLYNEI